MGRIVLVNPPITMAERYGHLSSGGSYLPPLNLANLAAVIRNHGHEPIILDAEVLGLSPQQTLEVIRSHDPDWVGFTATTISIHSAANMALLVKEQLDLTTMIGGVHLSNAPDETMERFPQFDIGVIGEGEVTTVALLDSLENGESLSQICGLIYKEGSVLKKTPSRERIKKLDELPFPAWDLLPRLERYYRPAANSFRKLPSSSLITSRGCPGQCTFCSSGVYGRKLRAYSAEYIMEMIRFLYYKYGIRDIIFHDDNFATFKRRTMEICENLISENLDLVWSCTSRVDNVTPELLGQMARAGCWQIAYGIESGSQQILDNIQKNITLDQIRNALWWTHEAGIRTRGYLMIGNPGETRETIQQTIDFIKSVPLDDFHISVFTPGPGTKALEDIDKWGTFENDWAKMNYWRPLFVPHGFTADEIIFYQNKVFREFYIRPSQIWKQMKNVSSFDQLLVLARSGWTLLKTKFA